LPEFWKLRPVIVLSKNSILHGTVIVIPCSTKAQPLNRWAKKLEQSINNQESWAICDKITTVAVSRLSPHKGGIKRISETEFNDLLKIIYDNLPQIR
jgi:mRNA interferase MazF